MTEVQHFLFRQVFAALVCLMISAQAIAQDGSDLDAIREASAERVAAIEAKDAVELSAMYASDGAFMIPNAPTLVGEEAIQKAWRDLFELSEFTMEYTISRIDVAESGEMAMDFGRYEFSFNNDSKTVSDIGKYLIVWTLIDGQWRIAADMFSSNGPTR